MGKVKIKVDWCDKNFAACPENENIACVVTHKTLEGLQKDMEEALRQHVEWMIEDGDALPEEFLGDIEFEYHLTTRAQLRYSCLQMTFKRYTVIIPTVCCLACMKQVQPNISVFTSPIWRVFALMTPKTLL